MTLETTREDIFVALIEGLSFDLAVNVDRLRELGIAIDSVRVAGGGSLSPLWLKIKADILGMPIHTLRDPEASALGCVMLAATAMGQFPDIRRAAETFVAIGGVYHPDLSKHECYQEKIGEFEKKYLAARNADRSETC